MSNAVSKEGALQSLKLYRLQRCFSLSDDVLDVAIIALSEIQQYRAIGTVSEFRELKEKATAKKPIYSDFDENEDEEIIPYKAVCSVCGHEFEFGTWNDEQNHHCDCGQKLDWSEGKE